MSKTPKKFALIGTSCTGKTTLFLELKEELPKQFPDLSIGAVPEAAREYIARVKTTNSLTLFHQENIGKEVLENEKKYGNSHDLIICDRSVIDSPCFVRAIKSKEESDLLLSKVSEWISTYTHFFLLDPKDIPYTTDEVRRESEEFRNDLHKVFLEVLSERKLPYTFISGNREERLSETIAIIKTFVD